MRCTNYDAVATAQGELEAGNSVTILGALARARILSARLVAVSGLTLEMTVGGSVSLQPSPVTFEATIEDLVVENQEVVVTATGAGTGSYSITWEYL